MADLSFNLVDEKWIPCIWLDGSADELGILEILIKADKIQEIFNPSPLVTASLHRLLLAILHRNFGPASTKEWKQIWQSGCFDEKRLRDYFNQWRGRFDLFDKEHPFYQIPNFANRRMKMVPISDLIPELARGHNPTLFDHTFDEGCTPVGFAIAARNLIAIQAFKLGGLSGLDANFEDAPSARNTIFIVRGENLFQTLMLNLVRYNSNEPLPVLEDDQPAWEQERPLESTLPNGYLDYLTWQTLRLRLVPDNTGEKIIGCEMALGRNLDKNLDQPLDPSVAYHKSKSGKGKGWIGLRFNEEKVLWRDSTSLFEFSQDEKHRPRITDWLLELVREGMINEGSVYRIDAYGMNTDPARNKINFWRHERMPLPLKYLSDKYLLEDLEAGLSRAESVGDEKRGLLRAALNVLAEELGGREKFGDLVRHLGAERLFWSRLEEPFQVFLTGLLINWDGAFGAWENTLRRTASGAFEDATCDLDSSARTLKALVEARRRLNIGLAGVFKQKTSKEV
jgi:CRISPR system Cascade subunit CasA